MPFPSSALFLGACIPVRLGLVYLTQTVSLPHLFWLGWIFIAIALAFLILFFGNLRLNAAEAGGTTWWAPYRLLFGMLYLTAGLYAVVANRIAWIPLAMETGLGIGLFMRQRLSQQMAQLHA